MVPEGWEQRLLGDVATFRNGLNFLKDSSGEKVRVVGIPHFWQRHSMLSFDEIEPTAVGRLNEDDLLRTGDLLFVRSNGNKDLIGRCMYFPLVEEPVSFSGFTIRGRVNRAAILPEYAAALMQTRQIKDQISRGGGGTNISNLSQAILSSIVVSLPPLPEQKKIAEILSTWDKAIETTEKLLANAEAQKRALMQQLLTGKRRLKGFEGSEWRPVALGDALVIEYGKSPKAIISTEGRYPVIGTGGETGRTDEFLVDTPAIVIGRKGTIDKPTMIEVPFWPIDTTFSCIARRGFDIRWVFRALQRVDLRRYNEASGVPSLSRDTLRSIHLVAPGKDEQAAIRAVIDHADQECTTIRRDVELLQAQKRALMQQLLTGKKRVKV